MRRRICDLIGFGNNKPCLLDNSGELDKQLAEEALKAYFSKEGGFDFKCNKNSISIGIEPTYQGDELKLITISRNKKKSFISTGKAFGPYGSGIRKTTRHYFAYKYKSKFVKFIDKWHKHIFG